MKKYIAVCMSLVVLLCACHATKTIIAPQIATPGAYRTVRSTGDTLSLGDIAWRDFFRDAPLQSLIDSAILKNFDLQVALKNIEAARLLYRQVSWNYVPQLALNVTANTTRPSDNSLNGLSLRAYKIGTKHIEDYSANILLSWEADIWGKINKQRKGAYAAYLQSAEAKRLIQTNVVTAVAQGYYNLQALDAELDIAKRNVRLDDSVLRIIRLQFASGGVTSLAVEQAGAQSLQAAQLIPQFEQNISIQEDALHVLSGSFPSEVVRSKPFNEINAKDTAMVGVPALLLSKRPDIRNAELAVAVADAKVGVTRAAMYPSIQITASGGANSFLASNWFNVPASLFGIATGSLVQPLVAHRQLHTQYQVSILEREQAVERFRQSVVQAVSEVSDALVKIQKLKTQRTIVASQVSILEQATKHADLLFQQGLATYLEVITAQGSVLQSELTLASIKRDELNAEAELYRALGGGWR